MQAHSYPSPTGPFAQQGVEEKKKRLDAMVKIWQSDTERHVRREDVLTFAAAHGLDEYRYAVWLRFPEWERSVVVGQALSRPALQADTPGTAKVPLIFTSWRRDPLLRSMPDWKAHLPGETVFNISVRITPGGLGEGRRWAIVMPRDLISRYRPGWPTQQEWVAWTRSFDWLGVGVGFIHSMLDR